PFRTLLDPTADEGNLPWRQLASGADRRHALLLVFRGDAPVQLALGQLTGNQRPVATEVRKGAGFGIEAQVGLALSLIGTMALEADIGKDWPDVAVEFDRWRQRLGGARVGSSPRHGNTAQRRHTEYAGSRLGSCNPHRDILRVRPTRCSGGAPPHPAAL